MRLPPDPVLVAARRWLELLPVSGGLPRAQALLTHLEEYSDLTPTQYASGLTLLQELGLLADAGAVGGSAAQILAAIFERAAPPWVNDADVLVQSPDDLPSDIVDAGEELGMDTQAVYTQLVSSWGKVDTAAREAIGLAGESALVEILRDLDGAWVDHVAARSDGFGYDIAFAAGGEPMHLEVKSTKRVGRFTAYLSRHEFTVMLRDELWVLVAVRLTDELAVEAVGSVSREWIVANVPRDEGPWGSWSSVKLEIPTAAIISGIPKMGPHGVGLFPAW